MRLVLVLVLVLVLEGSGPKSVPCDQVGQHIGSSLVVLEAGGEPDPIRIETSRQFTALCEADDWSQDARRCALETTTLPGLARCRDLLGEARQRGGVRRSRGWRS
jgi:hypothetical protein